MRDKLTVWTEQFSLLVDRNCLSWVSTTFYLKYTLPQLCLSFWFLFITCYRRKLVTFFYFSILYFFFAFKAWYRFIPQHQARPIKILTLSKWNIYWWMAVKQSATGWALWNAMTNLTSLHTVFKSINGCLPVYIRTGWYFTFCFHCVGGSA